MSQKMIPKRIPKAYSIWLIPNGEKYILLKNTIIELSHIFNGIKFIPHVTVLSNLNYSEKFLSKRVENIAKKVKPFFPNQDGRGTHMNISGGGILKHAPNKANAVKKNLKSKIHCPIKNFKATELYLAYNDEVNFNWEVINKFPLKQ